jgi:hypothetical protein
MLKEFTLTSTIFVTLDTETKFNGYTAPLWLCEGGIAGSTMDNRWFWNDHVMNLEVGETVETDFNIIKRIQ